MNDSDSDSDSEMGESVCHQMNILLAFFANIYDNLLDLLQFADFVLSLSCSHSSSLGVREARDAKGLKKTETNILFRAKFEHHQIFFGTTLGRISSYAKN
jgi:hypothetical protein